MEFFKIVKVIPLDNFVLDVVFENNKEKKYDLKKLINSNEYFKLLYDNELYKAVKVDVGGYGVSWNDDIDIGCNELYNNGELIDKAD